MGKKYIIPIEADPSALKKGVAEANAALTELGKNKVMVEIDYDHGDINDIRKAIDAITAYSPKIKVQLDYDLMSASLRQKQIELSNNLNLQKMLLNEKNGGEDLSNYITDILTEIDDGLDEGLSKAGLKEKLKKVFDLSESYRQYTGKYIADETYDFMYDLENRLNLDNYKPDTNIFKNLSEEIARTTSIINGFTLQLEDLKKAGAIETKEGEIFDAKNIKDATDSVNDLSSALSNIEDKTSTKSGKIKFFNGVKEQVLDVKDDIEEINELFETLSKTWSDVQFRTGTEFVDTKHRHDNLGLQLETGYDEPSFGNGTYFAQNFKDILKWKKNNKYPNIFASNLSNMQKMLRVESDDYLDDLQEAMRSMHAFIAKDLFPNENYEDMLDGIANVGGLYDAYKQQFSDLKVSQEELNTFIESQKQYLSSYVQKNGEIPKELYSAESITSKFFTELVGVSGISTSNLGRGDSSDYGSVIFKNLAKSLSYIDFGDNDELASKFAEMTLANIIKNKAKNPNVDLDEVYRQLTNTFQRDFNAKDFSKMATSSIYSEDVLKSLYETLQEAKRIQSELKPLSTSELNSDLFSRENNTEDINQQAQSDNRRADSARDVAAANREAAGAAEERAEAERHLVDATRPSGESEKPSSEIDEYTSKLERLYQLQFTINNIKPEAMFDKSWEEIGKYIEKLNAQYEQTVIEIERLRDIDDGSQGIKEQIGLLENLAVAYQHAMDASIPNDVSNGEWLSKYTNISRDKYFGIERGILKQDADEFKAGLDQAILDTFREANSKNIKIGDGISEETIKTSALSEIPEIMGRITSAGKEATQTMEQFHTVVEGDGAGGIGSTSDAEVESLRAELSRAEADAEAERRRAADAEERAQNAEEEALGYIDANTRLSNELADTRNELADAEREANEQHLDDRVRISDLENELYEANELNRTLQQKIDGLESDASSADDGNEELRDQIKKLESEKGLYKDMYDASVADYVAAEEENTRLTKENFDLQEQITSLKEKKADEKPSDQYDKVKDVNNKLDEAYGKTAEQINAEVEALNRLGASALTAAANKEIVTTQNTSLASAALISTGRLNAEADALERVAGASDLAADGKTRLASIKQKTKEKQTKENNDSTNELDSDKKRYEKIKETVLSKQRYAPLVKLLNDSDKALSEYFSGKGDRNDFLGWDGMFTDKMMDIDSTVSRTVSNIIEGFDKLSSETKTVFKSLFSDPNLADTEFIDGYFSRIQSYSNAVKTLKNDLGESDPEYQKVFEKMNNYQKSASSYFNKQFSDMVNKSLSSVTADIDSKKFTGDTLEGLKTIQKSLINTKSQLDSMDLSKPFDVDKAKEFVAVLKDAGATVKSINKKDERASIGDVDNLLRKVNKDIANNALSGSIKSDYLELQAVLQGIRNDAEGAADGLTSITKVKMGEYVNQWKALNQQMIASGMNQPKFLNQFKQAITNQSAQFLATYFSLQDFIRYGREIVQTVTEVDSAMTELRKVSGEGAERLDESFKTSAATAKELGATISEVINSTADWSRLGYDIDEAEKLANAVTLFKNVGDDMDQAKSTEYLVSTLQGFQLSSDQVYDVIDKYNEVANNYAINTAGRIFARVA